MTKPIGQNFLGAATVAAKLLKRGRNLAFIHAHLRRTYGMKKTRADEAIEFARKFLLPGYRKKKERGSKVHEFWSTGQNAPDFLRSAYSEFLGADGHQAYEDECADLFRVGAEWIKMPE